MAIAWVLFPLVMLAVCLGCGLLVERASGWWLPGALLPTVGLALVIVAATFTTSREFSAPWSMPVVVVLAVAGYAVSWARMRTLRPRGWPLAVGLAAFAVYAAPVVLSGNASVLGYFELNDPAFHFALIDQLLAHGRDVSSLLPSAYQAVVHGYISTSYPTGADVALGAMRPLVGQNVAWIFQPYLAVTLALGAVAIYELLSDTVESRPLRALCAFIAGQAGLLYSFYLEGSIKELATATIITATVALVVATLRRPLRLRAVLPLVVMAVAGLDELEVAIVPWLGPPLGVFVVVAAWRGRHVVRRMAPRRLALASAAAVAVLAVLAAPIVGKAANFFNVASGILTSKTDLGNLAAPLPHWQLFGIWPVNDFRFPVVHYRVTFALIGVAIASAILGALWTLRRRAFAPLLLLAGNGIAALYLLSRASPYASAKVMSIFSLTTVLAAMLGPVALHASRRRLEAWGLAAVLAFGVLWTNALGFQGAAVAPRARFTELAAIGDNPANQGPSLYNQADEYAIHFLHRLAPADPADGPLVPRPGLKPRTPEQSRLPWDTDELSVPYLELFRLLVIGRSPLMSRPPANFRLSFEGRYYDVWKRTSAPRVLEHIPLGSGLSPAAIPSCRLLMSTGARAAREHAKLAYVVRDRALIFIPARGQRPPDWGVVAGDPYTLIPRQQAGPATGSMRVTQPGRYDVWLEGSFSQRFQIWVGRQHIGSVARELGAPGQFLRVGTVTLAAGRQPVLIDRPANSLTPGGGDVSVQLLGPLVLVPVGSSLAVQEIAPSRARSLCNRRLDWVEIVR
jgi:hypothetical protein